MISRRELRESLARGNAERRDAGEWAPRRTKQGIIWRLVRLLLPLKRHSHKRENERRMRQMASGMLKSNWELWHGKG